MLRCAGGVEWLNAFYILRWMSWQILLTAYTQPHLKSSPAWSKEVKVAGHVFHFLFLDINHLQVQRDTKDKLKYDCWKYREKCMYSLCVCDNKTVLQLSRGSVILTTNETGDLISRCLPVWLMSSWCDGEQNMEAGDLKWSDFVMALRPHLLIRWKEEPLNEQVSGKYKLHIHIRDYSLFLNEHWTAADWIELNVKCRIKKRETSFSLIY